MALKPFIVRWHAVAGSAPIRHSVRIWRTRTPLATDPTVAATARRQAARLAAGATVTGFELDGLEAERRGKAAV